MKQHLFTGRGKNALKKRFLQKTQAIINAELELLNFKITHPESFPLVTPLTFESSLSVRGATSIYGSSKPLWVVDGVIMEDAVEVSADQLSSGDAETLISSAIAGLNADDIESFQILKDGSATSIYGARAMAGVIVVTTKKGKAGVSKINYTGEFTTRMVPSYKEFNIMNSQEQMGIYKELEQKGWLNSADLFRAKNSGVYGRMYKLIDQFNETNGQFGLMNTLEACVPLWEISWSTAEFFISSMTEVLRFIWEVQTGCRGIWIAGWRFCSR